MLNSIILMFSQYSKNHKASTIFKVIWVLYAIATSLFDFNLVFSLVNISVFLLVTSIIYYASKIYPKINASLSMISVLIYSLFVDILCYYTLPSWSTRQSLLQYITNGILFNYKYVFLNVAVFAMVSLCSKVLQKHKIKNLRTEQIL